MISYDNETSAADSDCLTRALRVQVCHRPGAMFFRFFFCVTASDAWTTFFKKILCFIFVGNLRKGSGFVPGKWFSGHVYAKGISRQKKIYRREPKCCQIKKHVILPRVNQKFHLLTVPWSGFCDGKKEKKMKTCHIPEDASVTQTHTRASYRTWILMQREKFE